MKGRSTGRGWGRQGDRTSVPPTLPVPSELTTWGGAVSPPMFTLLPSPREKGVNCEEDTWAEGAEKDFHLL